MYMKGWERAGRKQIENQSHLLMLVSPYHTDKKKIDGRIKWHGIVTIFSDSVASLTEAGRVLGWAGSHCPWDVSVMAQVASHVALCYSQPLPSC